MMLRRVNAAAADDAVRHGGLSEVHAMQREPTDLCQTILAVHPGKEALRTS